MNQGGNVIQIVPRTVNSRDCSSHFYCQPPMPKLWPEQIAKRGHLVYAQLAGAKEATDSDEGAIGYFTKDPGSKTVGAPLSKLPMKPALREAFVTNSADVFRYQRILKQKKHLLHILWTQREGG
jgi:hypothetical protein